MIDINRSPFSFPGSRLLISGTENRLHLQIASREPFFSIRLNEKDNFRTNRLDILFSDEKHRVLEITVRSFPHLLEISTEIGTFQLSFLDQNTIGIGLPEHQKCGIIFQDSSENAQETQKNIHPEKTQEFIYESSCPLEVVPLPQSIDRSGIILAANSFKDDALLVHLQDQSVSSPQSRPLSFTAIKKDSEKQWFEWYQCVPEINNQYRDQYYFAWWVLANNLVEPGGYLTHPAIMPSKAKYMGVWNWDTCFHAVGIRHQDPQLARNQLRLIIEHQMENGMLPDAVHRSGLVNWIDHPFAGEVTKPPLMAWAALKIHDLDPDLAFLEEIYPALCRWNDWWFERVDESGLPQYHHPYSSGLDDSPLWDHPFPITSPDLATYLVVQMRSLARIAALINKPQQAVNWEKQAARLIKLLVETLFDREKGYFNARSSTGNIDVCTPFNFLPILTNLLPNEIQSDLVNGLNKGGPFWKNFPLQTVSSVSQEYQPEVMWRGPVWININYLFIEALELIGETDLAKQLTEATLDLVNSNQGIFEYYNPETGSPPMTAAPVFSWSAALFIDLVIKYNKEQGNL